MELKVWVEGIQRIVCGVTVNTTCQDVVFALAHATGKVGRFTLIERWRNNERLLAPNENPLKLLLKWGEYANDVQFILQRSEAKQQQQTNPQQHGKQESQNNNNESSTVLANNNSNNNSNNNNKKPLGLSNTINNNNNNNNNNQHNTNNISNNNNNNNNLNKQNHGIENATTNPGAIPPATTQSQQQTSTKPLTMELSLNAAHERAKELKKSFGAHEAAKFMDNVGIVRGIPQRINTSNTSSQQHGQSTHNRSNNSNTPPLIPRHEKSHSNPIEMPSMPNNFYKANATAAAGAYQEHGSSNNNNNNNTGNTNNIYQQLGAHNSKSINEINLAEVRNALDRRTTIQQLQQQQQQLQQSQNQHNFVGSSELIFTTPTPTASGQQQQQQHKPTMMNTSNENLLDIFNGNASMPAMAMPSSNTSTPQPSNNSMNSPSDIYKQTPTISANGALVPPPYRDPPPPRNSPLQQQMMHYQNAERFMNSSSSSPSIVQQPQLQQQQLPASFFSQQQLHPPGAAAAVAPSPHSAQQQQHPDYEFIDYQQINELVLPASAGNSSTTSSSANMDEGENMFQATQYNDLLQLIKFQREKINQQQMELSKYDAEIVYLENKERDQAQELEAISMEITKADQLFRQGSEQLQTLQYVEEENELVKQQEKTLKSEIALLRSKLANCETELLQCKNKIRLLMDDIEIEQRAINNSKQNLRQNVERDFLMEMERIQSEIDQAIHNTDTSNKTAESLKKEILLIENAIQEKKRQVEQLVNEMKEVNLQSLTVTTSEEIKHLLEGSNKPGSSRRIIGSPRQLENAVPTSKNPHGVWV